MPEEKSISLKCENPWFSDVYSGKKDFEVRVDDRGYTQGMNVNLLEYDRAKDLYLGRSIRVRIKYILRDSRFVPEGKCVFGFERVGASPEQSRIDPADIPVTTRLSPETFRYIADMAKTNKVSVPDLVRSIVEERVGMIRRLWLYRNKRE